jgi:hypothetical protein
MGQTMSPKGTARQGLIADQSSDFKYLSFGTPVALRLRSLGL